MDPNSHLQLIPRRDGDIAFPEVGVRGFAPYKPIYR